MCIARSHTDLDKQCLRIYGFVPSKRLTSSLVFSRHAPGELNLTDPRRVLREDDDGGGGGGGSGGGGGGGGDESGDDGRIGGSIRMSVC